MNSEKATGAIRRIYDTRFRSRARTLEELSNVEVQFENGRANLILTDRQEKHKDKRQEVLSCKNFEHDEKDGSLRKSKTKSRRTSSILAERCKKEMELKQKERFSSWIRS
ncbi:hypothetical protein JTB14_001542 [Gonioctena quinquepunctata]|nr:hypothetical protein JTB14_001542 [Gonioctena quinquepunctata]